jgi:hypothetical protein
MAARKSQQFITGGRLWGNERVRLHVSLGTLAAKSGVPKGSLSLMEHGRLIPTSDEYDRVIAALAAVRGDQAS